MNIQIDNTVKRARGYWFVDGFIEIAAGILFNVLAAFLLISMKSSQASFPSWFLSVTGEIVILKAVSFVIVILILWWLKDNFTYPRTGLVRGRITASQIFALFKNLLLFLLLPAAGLLIASLFITSTGSVLSSMPVWFPIGLGILWGILLVLAGEWMGLHRFRWMAVFIFLIGISIGIWQWTMGLPNIPTTIRPELLQPSVLESINRSITSLGFILVGSGVIFIISGVQTFLRYRKENPQPYTEEV
ncbi:MAG: hypothetical protein ABI986_05165 [Chloroflexota bacterium]